MGGTPDFLRDMAWTSCGGRLSVIVPPPADLVGGLKWICTGFEVELAELEEEEEPLLLEEARRASVSEGVGDLVLRDASSLRCRSAVEESNRVGGAVTSDEAGPPI